jgi:hypothetical protein
VACWRTGAAEWRRRGLGLAGQGRELRRGEARRPRRCVSLQAGWARGVVGRRGLSELGASWCAARREQARRWSWSKLGRERAAGRGGRGRAVVAWWAGGPAGRWAEGCARRELRSRLGEQELRWLWRVLETRGRAAARWSVGGASAAWRPAAGVLRAGGLRWADCWQAAVRVEERGDRRVDEERIKRDAERCKC